MAAKQPAIPPAQAGVAKKKKHRSPAYPAINLAQAVKRADQFYKQAVKNALSFNAIAAIWDYQPKSSGALLTVAALKQFGLLSELDEASFGRTFQISPLGQRIISDRRPESNEREVAIKEAALKPKIHAELWRKYNGTIPPDSELEYRLENDWAFNRNAIKGFIAEFKETIKFAKLGESDTVSQGEEDSQEAEEPTILNIGDFAQWESGGQLKFPEPKRVTGFSEDGQFFFVEGQKAGFPIAEAIKEEPPATVPKPQIVTPQREVTRVGGSANMRQDVFSLTEGEVVISWPTPLSQDSIKDLEDWLVIVKRKIARSLATKEEQPAPDSPQPES